VCTGFIEGSSKSAVHVVYCGLIGGLLFNVKRKRGEMVERGKGMTEKRGGG
jgi:hypothetical protein